MPPVMGVRTSGEMRSDTGDAIFVGGSGVDHRVALDMASGWSCTCPWYARHRTERGPCKHILAARMFWEKDTHE